MLGDRRQVNAEGLLREVHAEEEGLEAGVGNACKWGRRVASFLVAPCFVYNSPLVHT